MVASTLIFGVPSAGVGDIGGGENGAVAVREGSGLEMPVGAISRLTCTWAWGKGAGHGVSGLSLREIERGSHAYLPITARKFLKFAF
jgi:hypothetical protein